MPIETPPRPSSSEPRVQASVPSSTIEQLETLFEDHIKLAFFEAKYEMVEFVKLAAVVVAVAVLAIIAFALLQVGLVDVLVHWGLPVWAASFILVGVYVLVAAILIGSRSRRDPRLGSPFQGTLEECERTAAWIHKRFF